jgi:signal transduction histidine kinase
MSFSDLLAFTNQLAEPEPAPPSPSDAKEELKASIEELKLVQEAQGVQVAQLLEAMTALARHTVRTPLRANYYFEPFGSTAQVPPMAATC